MGNKVEDVAFKNIRREYLSCLYEFKTTEELLEVAKHRTPEYTELLPSYFILLAERNKLSESLKRYENIFEKVYQIKIKREGKHIENIKELLDTEKSILQHKPEMPAIIGRQLQQKEITDILF